VNNTALLARQGIQPGQCLQYRKRKAGSTGLTGRGAGSQATRELVQAAVIDALAARVPGDVISLGTEVTSVEPGGNEAALRALAPVYGWQSPPAA
jgi:hypothetical protein